MEGGSWDGGARNCGVDSEGGSQSEGGREGGRERGSAGGHQRGKRETARMERDRDSKPTGR